MSALTVDPGPGHAHGRDDLVRLWEETDWPEGCEVEIIDGVITVSPPPATDHNDIADEIQRVLYTVIPGTGAFTRRRVSPCLPAAVSTSPICWSRRRRR